jgi:hypothetical protein
MKRILMIAIVAILCLVASTKTYSQLSVSYYSSSLSKIGLGYNFTPRFWSEVRLYGNTSLQNITPELVFCYNIAKKDNHNIYLGLGGNINYFTGFVMPIGVQFTPFEKFNRFSLHIELQPTFDLQSDIIIQSSWGLRYKFNPS